MDRLVKSACRLFGVITLTASSFTTQAAVIDNHVLIGPAYNPFHRAGDLPAGYDQAYSIRLGTGSWPFPYIDLFVDAAEGKNSYASISAGESYLTYVQNVNLVTVRSGDEISTRTLTDGSLAPFVTVKGNTEQQRQSFQVQPLTSPTGTDPDVYLGFSYMRTYDLIPAYGWAHLHYTQATGLTLVSSALTTTDAGIFALTRNTIPSVPETSTTAMLGLGLCGIMSLKAVRRRKLVSPN